ncbi:MAG TPA: TIGR02996 domain-containing protein [Gemmataceae bacterium]|nr:TIGR02996 domain-containing protein [Gemmataceae bacterium]
MTDRLSLLRAILANPAENTPRLMYADWLEENGTTPADAARVEFIRLWYRSKSGLRSTTKAIAAWLTEHWRRLWPSFPEAGARAQGRVLTVQFVGRRRRTVKAYFARGFAERVQFGDGEAYTWAGTAVATDEPLAVLKPEHYPETFGTYPTSYSIVRRDDWGPEVFARLAGFDRQPSADEKRYDTGFGLGHYRAREAVVAAMTALAREANGLIPQTQGAG